MKLFLQRYTEEQYLNVSEKVLPKLSPSISRYIGATVWKNGGDITNVINIGRLVKQGDRPQEKELIMNTSMRYGTETGVDTPSEVK